MWPACFIGNASRATGEFQLPLIRAKAAETFGRLGPIVQEYAKEIRPLLLDDWQMVREAATNALRAIEGKNPPPETKIGN